VETVILVFTRLTFTGIELESLRVTFFRQTCEVPFTLGFEARVIVAKVPGVETL
jgi:hypothetical protein